MTMPHSTAVLFAHVGNWLLGLASEEDAGEDRSRTPAPVHFRAAQDRLPPRDESFYWAWQYWSH
jgi:hypothetical protein